MSLTCHCPDYDDPDWWVEAASDFSILSTNRSRKCCSCGDKMAPGAEVLALSRWRTAGYDTIEEKIYGCQGEVPLATWYMCERCGGLFMALEELGFCVDVGDNMIALAKEYGEMQREDIARKREKANAA